jgi:glycosyltransferase involved in cell wall biosynthesis
VLKTKIFKTKEQYAERKDFEVDLKPTLVKLRKKYGDKMPEIKVVSKRLKSIAGLYAACDAFVLMTASEGWGVPYLEALAMGLPVIAPRHGGQLQFLNDGNAILTPCGTRKALPEEQYWGGHPKATVGKPDEEAFANAMYYMYQALKSDAQDVKNVLNARIQQGLKDASRLTWKSAMQQIIDLMEEHNDKLR